MSLFRKLEIDGVLFEAGTIYLTCSGKKFEVRRSGDMFYYKGTKLPTDKIFIKDGWTLRNYDDKKPEEGAEEYPLKNFRFVLTEQQGDECLFYIRHYSDQELYLEQLRADIDFLLFMTSLDEPMTLAASAQQTVKTSTLKVSTTSSVALSDKEEKIKRYFEMGLWTMAQVQSAYQKGIITSAAHFKSITGVSPTDQTM